MLLDNEKIIKVTNRGRGRVGYSIPELGNLHRVFAKGETKEITMGELRKLAWQPGGKAILEKFLLLDNKDAINELVFNVEPEYFYTEADVEKLLLTGSLDELKDCLDFAPKGVVDLVKHLAVKLEINDISKRDAIFAATGFNVTNAVMINRETAEEEEKETKTRRVQKTEEQSTEGPTRRVPKKYNVVSIKE